MSELVVYVEGTRTDKRPSGKAQVAIPRLDSATGEDERDELSSAVQVLIFDNSVESSEFVSRVQVKASTPTSNLATLGSGLLCFYGTATVAKPAGRFFIPAAKNGLAPAGSDELDLSGGTGKRFADAYAAASEDNLIIKRVVYASRSY